MEDEEASFSITIPSNLSTRNYAIFPHRIAVSSGIAASAVRVWGMGLDGSAGWNTIVPHYLTSQPPRSIPYIVGANCDLHSTLHYISFATPRHPPTDMSPHRELSSCSLE